MARILAARGTLRSRQAEQLREIETRMGEAQAPRGGAPSIAV